MSDAADNARLFIALWPDPAIREQLRAWRDSFAWPKPAAPVRTRQLHVTLHFLGNIPRARLPELAQGLGVGIAPFELELGHAELWRGGIAVLAPEVVAPPLLALHGALGAALQRLGLPLEARPYRPHVTLARRAGRELAPTIQGHAVRWQVDGYALMESKLGAAAEYAIVQSYPAPGSRLP
ncbi:MAG: 2-5 ligase [Massilia sp.]|jgi:2'-5' RNA ligase|nr:2-5 ligase [Massilia sp.]